MPCPAAARCAPAPWARSWSAWGPPRLSRPCAAPPIADRRGPRFGEAGGQGGRGLDPFGPSRPEHRRRLTVSRGLPRRRRWCARGRPGRARARPRSTRRSRRRGPGPQFGYNNDYVGVLPLDGERGRAARGQPRVHRREPDVPRLRPGETPTPRAGEIAMAAHGMSSSRSSADRSTGQWTAGPPPRTLQPPHHRAHTEFRLTGPAAGHDLLRTAADPTGTGPRHAQQLRRRHDPVGHGAVRRGELQPVLRQRRPAPRPGARPLRALRHRPPPPPSASGSGSTSASTSRKEPERGATASAGSSRSTRTTRLHARSSTPRWAASSTRAPTSRSPRTAAPVAYMGDDERFDYLYKFVSAEALKNGRGRSTASTT